MLKSAGCRRGGVCSLVGGVDDSDRPDDSFMESLIEGLLSAGSRLLFFLREGTASGHTHCRSRKYENMSGRGTRLLAHLVIHEYIAYRLVYFHHTAWLGSGKDGAKPYGSET